MAEAAGQLGKMVELPNPCQPNPGSRPDGQPCRLRGSRKGGSHATRAGRILPIVEVVSGQHGAVGGVEVQSPYAVGVQKVHKTGRGRSGGCV